MYKLKTNKNLSSLLGLFVFCAARLWRGLLVIGIVAACLLSYTMPAHAYGPTQCLGSRNGSDVNCNAKDVQITGMRVVGDTTSCIGGTNITVDLEITVNFAVPDRYDIGIFISNDGKEAQLLPPIGAASCSVGILPPSSPFLNLDGPTDTCGDGNKNIGGGTGSGITYMTNVTVPCQAKSGSGGNLYIPFAVSWDNQKTPPGAICTSIADPVANTPSKCNVPDIAQGTVTVVVMPTISKQETPTPRDTVSSGETVNYTVTITNTTGDTLSNIVFKDPAVTNITVNSVNCSPSGGASCPGSVTVAGMQGAGLTIPSMPVNSTVTFTINATLTGTPPDTLTNTASVTVGSQTKSASDTDTVVGTIAIIPTSLSKSGSQGTLMVFNYTLYNFASCTSATTTLSNNIDNSQTTIANVASTSGFPSQGRIQIDSEYILYTGITATSFTGATRGYQGTTAANHNSGATVSLLCSNDTISLSAASNQGWTYQIRNAADTADITSLTVPAGGSSNFIIKVQIPGDAAIGTVDTTTITAISGNNPSKTATATAVTTVSDPLTFTPNNTGSGGKGSSAFYDHRVQNNTATNNLPVTFPSVVLSGSCAGWTAGVYKSDKVTVIPPATVTLAAFGGYEDIVVKVTIPSGAGSGDVCTVKVTASGGGNTPEATDTTTVKDLVLYLNGTYTDESYIFPVENDVYARAFGALATTYKFCWYDSSNTLMRTSPLYTGPGILSDTYLTLPNTPLGTWHVGVQQRSAAQACDIAGTFFAQTNFYVGPDHLKASYTYTGANPSINSNVTIDLALHGKDHLVPLDPSSGNVVQGNPPTTKDPLKITVTVSGSATITEYCNPGCTSIAPTQTVTFNLPDTTGTATITITASAKGPVTITPDTYNSALYGSSLLPPYDRDEFETVQFVRRRMRILDWREVQ